MRLKDIDKVPVAAVRRKGKWLRVVDNLMGLLIIDVYKDKVYAGRYVQNPQSGEYASKINGEWCVCKLETLLTGERQTYWSFSSVAEWKFYPGEEEKGNELYKDVSGYTYMPQLMRKVESQEYNYNSQKRADAYDRKVMRINTLMDSFPVIDRQEFADWWLKTCEGVKDKEYMFYDKEKGKYGCTACGKEHIFKDGKHRQTRTCKKTGKEAVLLKRQDRITVTDYAIVLSNIDTTQAAERLLEVTTTYSYSKKSVWYHEDIRVMLSKVGKKVKIYYSQSRGDYLGIYRRPSWWNTNTANKRWKNAYLYPADADVLAGTVYEKSQVTRLGAMGVKLNYNGLLINYDKAPCFEYLVKMGLNNLALEISESWGTWGNDSKVLNWHGSSATEIMGINMQRIHRLKNINGGVTELEWLRHEEKHGKKISDAALAKFAELGRSPVGFGFILDHMSPEKIANYATKQVANTSHIHSKVYYTLSDWEDYLKMAKRLGMNVNDPIVYAPKNNKVLACIIELAGTIPANGECIKIQKDCPLELEEAEGFVFNPHPEQIRERFGKTDVILDGQFGILQRLYQATSGEHIAVSERVTAIINTEADRSGDTVDGPYMPAMSRFYMYWSNVTGMFKHAITEYTEDEILKDRIDRFVDINLL